MDTAQRGAESVITQGEFYGKIRLDVTHPKTMSYQYDMAGRCIQMTNPDGGVTQYTYDLADRLTSVKDPQGFLTTYSFDAANRLTQAILGNSIKTLYTYDDANRLTKVDNRKSDNTVINSFTYTLDAAGNRLRMTEANGDYTDYGYDNVYQLLSEVKKNSLGSTLYSYAYTYDNVGNRLTMIKDGVQTTYTYDANNRLLTAGAVSFGYDTNGNTTSRTGPTTYQYDYENHLTKITYSDGSKNWFTYDGDGARMNRRDSEGPKTFLYDGADIIQERSQVTGEVTVAYGHGVLSLMQQYRGGVKTWYLLDGLGSVRSLVNAAQTITDSYSYDAFGNGLLSSGSTVNPFRYVGGLGYYRDVDSGMLLVGARYCDPSVGRFVTPDPLEEGVNWYAYVRNHTPNAVDPSGYWETVGRAGNAAKAAGRFVRNQLQEPKVRTEIVGTIVAATMVALYQLGEPLNPFQWDPAKGEYPHHLFTGASIYLIAEYFHELGLPPNVLPLFNRPSPDETCWFRRHLRDFLMASGVTIAADDMGQHWWQLLTNNPNYRSPLHKAGSLITKDYTRWQVKIPVLVW